MTPQRVAAQCLVLLCAIFSIDASAGPAGRVERIVVHGTSLEGNLSRDSADRQVSVYLPPGYDEHPERHYPVVYVLHGYGSSDEYWFDSDAEHFVNLPEEVDSAIASGARPMILVMPNAHTRYLGSMYASSVTTGDWEAFVARELVAHIDSRYRTLPRSRGRGLAGHSMGGYGTLRIAMKHPGVFSSIYAMNPCCLAADRDRGAEVAARAAEVDTDADIRDAGFAVQTTLAMAAAWSPDPAGPPRFLDLPYENGAYRPDVAAAWAANAPLAMIHQYVPALRGYQGIALDAGEDDLENIDGTVREFSRLLDDYGITHSVTIYDGDHVSGVARRLREHVVPFFAGHLSDERRGMADESSED